MNERDSPIPTSRKLLFTAATIFAAILVIFVVSEVSLRIAHGKIERITGAVEWEVASWKDVSYFWDKYHPLYGWTNLPGYRSDDRVPFKVTINNQGLRATEDYAPSPPDGVERIAVFGDSCTFGEEVDDGETLPAYLERHLDNAEVLNFGVRGYGLGQMALRLEDEGFALNPDQVVFVLLLPSDLSRDATDMFTHPKPVFRVADSELSIENTPVPLASQQPWVMRHCFFAAWLFGRPLEANEAGSLDAHLEVTRAILRRVSAQCEARGVRLTIVTIITGGTVPVGQSTNAVFESADYARRQLNLLDLDVLDLVGYLRKAYIQEGRTLLAPQGHWSGRGNCLAAGEIARHLRMHNPRVSLSRRRPDCAADMESAETRYLLGNARKLQGKLDDAMRYYRTAIRIDAQHVAAHLALGRALSEQGAHAKAVSHFRRAISAAPDNARAHYHLAEVLTTTGPVDEALEHYREAARLQPAWPPPVVRIAWILATHSDPAVRDAEEAVRCADRAVKLAKQPGVEMLDTLAAAYASTGDFEQAVRTARSAIAVAAAESKPVESIRERLRLYKNGEPYRESPPDGVD